MTNHLLDVQDLHISFDTHAGEVQAVRGVSFWLDAGEMLSIVGESGCGKSVTIQTIMKLLPSPIKSGSITYQGADITHLSDKAMESYRGKEFSMIFQDSMTSLNPTMRVGRQMCEGILRHQKVSRQEAQRISVELLGQVGLPNPELAAKRYPHTMSGGQRQRVMIAMAMACNPKILFADEPTTALDVTMQAQILDLMNHLKEKRGTSILLITHDLGVVAQTCEKVMVMYAGEAIEYGTAEDIFETTQRHPYTQGLFNAIPKLDENTKRLEAIEGMMADPTQKIEGCRFADRCKYATAACKKAQKMREVTPGHFIRCCRFDPPQSNT